MATLGAVSPGQSYTFTNLQSAITGNGRVTFVIRSTNEDGGGYYTKEWGTANQRPVLQVTYTVGGSSYSYHANGNLVSGGGRTISYNAENKPTSITANGQTTTFIYDGDGGRVKKIAGATTMRYIGKLYECDNTSCTRFIFAGNTRIATVAVNTGAVHYWHQDHLSSSSVITDSTGALVQTLAYYPYGATRTNQSSANPAVDVPYKYTGKELDSTTGLYYYEARYYDPTLGRFISADTIVPNPRDPQDLNRYTYAGNNPFRYTDRTGHFKLAKVLDRIFENKFLRIAGWVLFPQQMVFVDPATRRYAVPAAAGVAGYVACAPVGLGSVCGGAAAGAVSALVSQSEGRGGNVGRSALAGGAAGAAGSFASGIVGCSVLCGGAAAGVVNAAIMGGDLRKGAIRGAIGGAVTAAYVLGMQYAGSGVFSTRQVARDSSSMNVDQSYEVIPAGSGHSSRGMFHCISGDSTCDGLGGWTDHDLGAGPQVHIFNNRPYEVSGTITVGQYPGTHYHQPGYFMPDPNFDAQPWKVLPGQEITIPYSAYPKAFGYFQITGRGFTADISGAVPRDIKSYSSTPR